MNHYHVLVGMYKPQVEVCQVWPFELRECEKKKPLTQAELVDVIIAEVCEAYRVKLEQMRERTRKRQIVEPRQITQYFLKKYTTLTLNTIGGMLGDLDHTDVKYAFDKVTEISSIDKDYRNALTQLETKIKERL